MKKIANVLAVFGLVCLTSSAYSENSFNLHGNYVQNSETEKTVISFKDDGVLLIRRFKRKPSEKGLDYSSTPYESIWSPYIVHAANLAKALVCENGNPFGHCLATPFSKTENGVNWDGTLFVITDKSFSSSKFDFGPYTFDKLAEIYKFKFSKIEPLKEVASSQD